MMNEEISWPQRDQQSDVGSFFILHCYFFFGSTASTSLCGRPMTWTLTSSPLMALMACAPASVAALTAATSPTTQAETSALPTWTIGPTNSTLAALSIA